MKRKPELAVAIAVTIVSLAILTAEQIHEARWTAEWHGLGDEAVEFQDTIDRLTAEGAPDDRIELQRRHLSDTLRRLNTSFTPHLIPTWLRAVSVVGVWAGGISLWRLLRRQHRPSPAA